MIRALVRLLTISCLVAAAFLVPVAGTTPISTASAAPVTGFDPGYIISDEVFFDGWTMDAAAIQQFLNAKGSNCTVGNLCLKNYRVTTVNQPADAWCPGGYAGAPNESVAVIIEKVARSCGVNPRVILVLLQKEQGMVTGSPTESKYVRAAGFKCPDRADGWCDPTYAGLQNQIYHSARQYQRYADGILNNYRPGMWHNIQWSPNAACGSSRVYVANQATAGLYAYTPYQPNQASLNAYPGEGDGCSSYGNRNFYAHFVNWFGTTGTITVPGSIGAVWNAEGGGAGYLGYPAGPQVCGLLRGGCGQHFQGGSIYWSPSTPALPVSGALRAAWAAGGWEGGFGYPTWRMDCTLRDGGCAQGFEGGVIVWSGGTGARTVSTAVRTAWDAQGGLNGPLGYPTADQVCGLTGGGCRQQFQGGTIYSSPSGAGAISGGIGGWWQAQGAERGPLGYPVGPQICLADGCSQAFERGSIGWTAANGIHATDGAIGALWARLGHGTSAVGHPTGDMTCGLTDGGCRQAFQRGSIYWSAGSGAASVSGSLGSWWTAQGADAAPVGYPTGEMVCVAGGCRQDFRAGTVTEAAGAGVRLTNGAIAAYWLGQRAGAGALGYPSADMTCALPAGGCGQAFQGGNVYWSPGSGTHGVTGGIAQHVAAQGGVAGPLAYPVGEATCGLTGSGCRQPFQGGTVYWSPASGVWGVFGGIAGHWTALGAERSSLGYPTAAMVCAGGGCSQQFQNGWLGWTPAAGVRVTSGAIGGLWHVLGAGVSVVGHPVDDLVCGLAAGGCRQTFERGSIYWSAAGGAHSVSGGIRGYWTGLGAERSALRYPTAEMVCTAAGCSQQFQEGQLAWSETAGVRSVTGAINLYWTGRGGIGGALGAPLTEAACSTGCTQTFQNGVVAWSSATGPWAVSGPIRTAWTAAGAGTGSLGYPLADAYPVAGGTAQDFQRGRLTLDTASGTVTRS